MNYRRGFGTVAVFQVPWNCHC